MRVTVVRGGGVAGMTVTTTLDTADLDEPAGADLRSRVAACTLADRARTSRPDGVRVELRVDDDGTVTRARFDEHDAPEGAADLVGTVLDSPAARRTVGR